MSQQPPPPQFSPDGLFWWDGVKWVPRPGVPAVAPQPQPQPPPSFYYSPVPPPPPPPGRIPGVSPYWYTKPSPGLRIVLIVALAIELILAGLLSFAFIIAAASGGQDAFSYGLGALCLIVFVVSGAALIGAILRAPWARWVAIAAGILVSWTCIGLVLGIPIFVTAGRLEIASHQGGGSRQY